MSHAMLYLARKSNKTNVVAGSTVAKWDHHRPSRIMAVSTPQIHRLGLGSPTVQVVVEDATSRRLLVLVQMMCHCHRQTHAGLNLLLHREVAFLASQVSGTLDHLPHQALRCWRMDLQFTQAEPHNWVKHRNHLRSRRTSQRRMRREISALRPPPHRQVRGVPHVPDLPPERQQDLLLDHHPGLQGEAVRLLLQDSAALSILR